MIELTHAQALTLRTMLPPEAPGRNSLPRHMLNTGHGQCWVDRWPQPRAALVTTGDNYLLSGDPSVLTPAMLRPHHVSGFVAAAPVFAPLLQQTFPDLVRWERIIFTWAQPRPVQAPVDFVVRQLAAGDEAALTKLGDEVRWVYKTWVTPQNLARSGYAWGAFSGSRLVSLAATFFLGDAFEEIGVATEPEFRGQGLSSACTAGLCAAVLARGRAPSWTTSLDNVGSRRVAEKVGFTFHSRDVLYMVGVPIP